MPLLLLASGKIIYSFSYPLLYEYSVQGSFPQHLYYTIFKDRIEDLQLNILNLKEAEDIAITKIARRADYRPVSADSNMEDLMEKAMDQNFVPVIDDQQNFIGIITRKDIIGYCYEKIKKIAN